MTDKEYKHGDLTQIKTIPLMVNWVWKIPVSQLSSLCKSQGMRADGGGLEGLIRRRRAMSVVMPYCSGVGLDIGCRQNKLTPDTIGIELNKRYVGGLWGPNIVRDGTDLSIFSDNSMDYIFAGHMLEDLEDPISCLYEWIRVVKHEGHICLLTPHADYYPRAGQPGANPMHRYDYWPQSMAEQFEKEFDDVTEIVQLETYCNKFDFDLVMKINKE